MSASIRRRLRRIGPWWRRLKRNGYRRERCDHCGHPFRSKRDPRHASGNRDGKVWHGPCMAYLTWRRRAKERLAVLGYVVELTGVTAADVRDGMNLRDEAGQPGSGSSAWNLAWRVFRDLEQSTSKDVLR